MRIVFFGRRSRTFETTLRRLTDAQIELAKMAVERKLRRRLPVDPKTGYPSFAVYNSKGEEIGGG